MHYFYKSAYGISTTVNFGDLPYKNKKIYFEYNHNGVSGNNLCFGLFIARAVSSSDTLQYYVEMYPTNPSNGGINFCAINPTTGNGYPVKRYYSYSATNNPGMGIDFLNNTISMYGDGKLLYTITNSTYTPIIMNDFNTFSFYQPGESNYITYKFKYFRNECVKVPSGYQTIGELLGDNKIYDNGYMYAYQ